MKLTIVITKNKSIHRWAFNKYASYKDRISWHMGPIWLSIEWWKGQGDENIEVIYTDRYKQSIRLR